jgi:hypothetical protein
MGYKEIEKNLSFADLSRLKRATKRAKFPAAEVRLANFVMKQVEFDEYPKVVDGIIEDAWSWMEFGKRHPLSCWTALKCYDFAGLPIPSEQG